MFEFYWQWLKKAFPLAYGIAGFILFIFTIITPFLQPFITKKYPQMETKLNISLSTIVLVIFGLFLLVRLIMAPYEIYKEQKKQIEEYQKEAKQFATPDELTASHLKGLTIRIADLVREDIVIRNKVFEDCYIYGPAMLALIKDNIFVENQMGGSLESIFVPTENPKIIGAIALENCVFKKCHFRNTGIIGLPAEIEKIKQGFSQ